ncbi:AMP-binding protein [Fibrella aquatilis]|uniref:AMP-binding protein n=1 Tax=Fibrella aquatilis TaxID=2817059 RepID=A0A939GBX6_9BACT|nr:AMP-binding protein [Fibrella aquatilis]MBO0933782.1 AMP-binding protein [Fibrella aquatilis]
MVSNYYALIHERLQQHLDDDLICWPDTTRPGLADMAYTGRAILTSVAAIRAELVRQRVQPGQQVVLALPVSFDLIGTLLASMALGAILVLPPAAARWALLRLLLRGDVTVLLTKRPLPAPLSWLGRLIGIRNIALDINSLPPAAPLPPQAVDPDQPALISHSSGSTGVAKAIRRSHRVLLAQHQALTEAFPPWAGQRDFPLFLNILLHNLALGTLSILPALPGFRLAGIAPERIVQQLVDQGVQTLTGNVYYFQQLLQYLHLHPTQFPQVRALGIGGSPVPEGLAGAIKTYFVNAAIYVIYGSSEAEPIAIRQLGTEPLAPRRGYAVGTVHPSLQVAIHPIGTLLLPGGKTYAVGEIAVKGPHVATPGNDWFMTGDFGYLDEADQLFLTGRRGNERLHQGVQHYQIEHVLTQVAGVERVAARATEQGFTVYVQGNASQQDLSVALATTFPETLINHLYFRSTLPVDARHLSKIRYDQLT